MHKLNVHAIAVVAEDLNLIFINDVATVTAYEILAKLVLDSLGGTAQHIVAEFAIGFVVNLYIVILRLYIVEAVDIDTHLQTTGTINKVYEFWVGIVGFIIHHVHAYAVEQCTLVAIDGLLQADDIGHNDDKR